MTNAAAPRDEEEAVDKKPPHPGGFYGAFSEAMFGAPGDSPSLLEHLIGWATMVSICVGMAAFIYAAFLGGVELTRLVF